jgi:hypothetical protein
MARITHLRQIKDGIRHVVNVDASFDDSDQNQIKSLEQAIAHDILKEDLSKYPLGFSKQWELTSSGIATTTSKGPMEKKTNNIAYVNIECDGKNEIKQNVCDTLKNALWSKDS